MIGLFLLSIFAVGLLSIVYFTLRLGISPLPSSKKAKEALFSLLPQDIEGDLYELGSGWGHLLIPLARRYPKNTLIAYEASWVPYLFSLMLCRVMGLKNVEIRRADFLQANLTQARHVVVYLSAPLMNRLSPLLPPEALIVSNTFALPGRSPTKTLVLDDLFHTRIYLYHDKVKRL